MTAGALSESVQPLHLDTSGTLMGCSVSNHGDLGRQTTAEKGQSGQRLGDAISQPAQYRQQSCQPGVGSNSRCVNVSRLDAFASTLAHSAEDA